MQLRILDEFSPLKKVIVGYSDAVPEFKDYLKGDYDWRCDTPWDKKLILKQQTEFFNILKNYGVELLFTDIDMRCPWQMFTRDTGFVYHDMLFHCVNRRLRERVHEFDSINKFFKDISRGKIVEIEDGFIEGGDVLADKDQLYIGQSDRTDESTINKIEKYFPVKKMYLGKGVMHLDTRMTILPGKNLLIYPEAFQKEDLEYLKKRFSFISVTKEEVNDLGTNVFIINPKTIVVHKGHVRIRTELQKKGFRIEPVDYSQFHIHEGSFRCTTLPIEREY